MPHKGHKAGSSAQLRTHSRSSSGSRVGNNLQFTQKDGSAAKGTEKGKKNTYMLEGARPGFQRANSSQRLTSNAQVKRTASTNSTNQNKANATKQSTGFIINQNTENDDDDDEWVSSSGAQTPNQNDSDSDTASEGDSIPQELHNQLERAQLEQVVRAAVPLARVDTARQSDFSPAVATSTPAPKQIVPTQKPFPTSDSDSPDQSDRYSQYTEHHQTQSQHSPGHADIRTRETNHPRPNSRHSHQPSSKRQSVTRPPSSLSISSRFDVLRPHPLIRGHSHGHVNSVLKPSPLAPLTVISDQPSNSPTDENQLSTSPTSIRTTVTTPGGYEVEFSHERRTSFSSARSVSTLPAQSTIPPRHYDRSRTLSTMSISSSSAALSSLAHLPNVTRPPSPQQISFFPPVNPHVNIEATHPLLPGPYLNNHMTVLARRTPVRESYDRVIQAKTASGR